MLPAQHQPRCTGTEQLCCGNGNVWHDPSPGAGSWTLFSFKVLFALLWKQLPTGTQAKSGSLFDQHLQPHHEELDYSLEPM